jgi:hypothetical protein
MSEVKVMAGVPGGPLPRVELRVRKSGRGDVIATWTVVTASAASSHHRVSHPIGSEEPVGIAFQHARAHAQREGIEALCIIDPENLFPEGQRAP